MTVARVLYCVVSLCLVRDAWSQWTVVTTSPDASSNSAGCEQGSLFVIIPQSSNVYLYDSNADTWSQTNKQPTNRLGHAAAPTVAGVLVAGGNSDKVEELKNPLTGLWVSRSPLPAARIQGLMASDGATTSWYISGATPAPTSHVDTYAYSFALDAWSAKTPIPDNKVYGDAEYIDGVVMALSNGPTPSLYTVATDAWKYGESAPVFRANYHQGLAAVGGYFFSSAGTLNSDQVHRYHPPTDVWTILDPTPTTHSSGKAFVVNTGQAYYLYVFGDFANGIGHKYFVSPAAAASVIGDPDFNTFSGRTVHLDLNPSVYHVLSTPSMSVNALIDQLDTLPPEANLVIVMVAVLFIHANAVHVVECSAQQESEQMTCDARVFSDLPASSLSFEHVQEHQSSLELVLPDIKVTVTMQRCPVMSGFATEMAPPSNWLELSFNNATVPFTSMDGIFAALENRDENEVRAGISDYDTVDGCLFAPHMTSLHAAYLEKLHRFLCLDVP